MSAHSLVAPAAPGPHESLRPVRRPMLPDGVLGGVSGAIGALPLIVVAGRLGRLLGAVPALPGAERAAADIKLVSYAEAAGFLTFVPLAALFFGWILPRRMARRTPRGTLSFEWAGAGLACSLPLWRRGEGAAPAMLAGLGLAAVAAAGISWFRSSFALRRLFTRAQRRLFGFPLLGGACLAMAWRGAPGVGGFADGVLEILLAGVAFAFGPLLVCVGSAARLSAWRSYARWSWIAVCGAAVGIVRPQWVGAATAGAVAAWLSFALMRRPPARWRVLGSAALVAFVGTCGLSVYYAPGASVDLFEDGHALANAQMYLLGARPYVGTAPLHGLGSDGGLDAVFFRVAGASLHTFRIRQALSTAAAVAAVALAGMALLPRFAGGLGLLLILAICPFVSDRHALAFAAAALLVAGVKRERHALVGLGGAVGALALFYSLDMGLVVLAGGGLGLATLPLLERSEAKFRRTGRRLGAYLAGAGAGALPVGAWLAHDGALGAFFRTSFLEIPRTINGTWGLPGAGIAAELVETRGVRGLLGLLGGGDARAIWLLTVLAAAGVGLVWRGLVGRFDEIDAGAWVALMIALAALRGVLGRADPMHLALYGAFAGLPAAWLVWRSWKDRAGGRAEVAVAAALLVAAGIHPVRTIDTELYAVRAAPARRIEDARGGIRIARCGASTLPAAQANAIRELKAFVDARAGPEGTFFDFSNEPALYFFLDRSVPVRYFMVAQYESPAAQREVIAALERTRPSLALLSGGGPGDAPDGIPNADRAPEVAAYLGGAYPVVSRVAGWTVGQRPDPTP